MISIFLFALFLSVSELSLFVHKNDKIRLKKKKKKTGHSQDRIPDISAAFKCLTHCATDTSYLGHLHPLLLSYVIIGERNGLQIDLSKMRQYRGPGGRRYIIWCIAALDISPHHNQKHAHVIVQIYNRKSNSKEVGVGNWWSSQCSFFFKSEHEQLAFEYSRIKGVFWIIVSSSSSSSVERLEGVRRAAAVKIVPTDRRERAVERFVLPRDHVLPQVSSAVSARVVVAHSSGASEDVRDEVVLEQNGVVQRCSAPPLKKKKEEEEEQKTGENNLLDY